ncbi:UNKNOWN [Stylonychia lemnae]|uniref:Uncharacterized protein n=1 Tax=Stylonychia lemnae TaxID=5949 RepID=A0A078ALL5_STYLE|nr:UNKNOWN [Stylonychia lemnae]|eukprot:CDW81748.1 UNKNOWN [Stylonychia lemnae]
MRLREFKDHSGQTLKLITATSANLSSLLFLASIIVENVELYNKAKQVTGSGISMERIDETELRYQREILGYNSFTNHQSNNPDESNSYMHLSSFPA